MSFFSHCFSFFFFKHTPQTLGGNILRSSERRGDTAPLTTVLVGNYPAGAGARPHFSCCDGKVFEECTHARIESWFFSRGPRNNVAKPCRYGLLTGVRLPRSDSTATSADRFTVAISAQLCHASAQVDLCGISLPKVALIVTVQLSRSEKQGT